MSKVIAIKQTSMIESATAGLTQQFRNHLDEMSKANALVLANFIDAMRTETSLSDNYRLGIIKIVSLLSRYHDNKP